MSYISRSILYFAEPVFEDEFNLSVLTSEKDIPVGIIVLILDNNQEYIKGWST